MSSGSTAHRPPRCARQIPVLAQSADVRHSTHAPAGPQGGPGPERAQTLRENPARGRGAQAGPQRGLVPEQSPLLRQIPASGPAPSAAASPALSPGASLAVASATVSTAASGGGGPVAGPSVAGPSVAGPSVAGASVAGPSFVAASAGALALLPHPTSSAAKTRPRPPLAMAQVALQLMVASHPISVVTLLRRLRQAA